MTTEEYSQSSKSFWIFYRASEIFITIHINKSFLIFVPVEIQVQVPVSSCAVSGRRESLSQTGTGLKNMTIKT